MIRIAGTLHEDHYTLMTISRSVLPRMRNFSNKSCGENQNIFYVEVFFSVNHSVYEVMWKYGRTRQATDENLRCRLRIACWITKATKKIRI
jgi:hypothetical protein